MEALLRRLDAATRSGDDSHASDREQYIIEELYAALETGTLPWHELSPDFKDARELPARDMGIDSASEECAVQTKWRPMSRSVGAREIAMFLASAKLGPKPWSRAIVATQDGVRLPKWRAHEYERINIDDTIRAKWRDRAREMSVAEVSRESDGAPIVLRDYQIAAIDLIRERMYDFFRENVDSDSDESDSESEFDDEELSRIRIQLPCGSGKSLIIARVVAIARENDMCALILVPSRVLLAQFDELLTVQGIAHGLRGTGYNDTEEQEVTICVYDSAQTLARDYDVILVDEAHHLETPMWCDETDDSSQLTRDIHRLQYAQIDDGAEDDGAEDDGAGTSASASASASSRESLRAMVMMFSATIDDADYSVDVEALVSRGLLSDYDIVVPVFRSDTSIGADSLARYVAQNRGEFRAILVYSNRCVRAREICDAFVARGISCAYFDGNTSVGERERLLRAFESGEIAALSTVNTISEGQNLPRANTCIFAEPRHSKIAIVQCIGRVLRLHDEKIMAHIVVPYAGEDDEREVARIIGAIDGDYMRRNFARKSSRIAVVRGDDLRDDADGDARGDADIDDNVDALLFENIYDRLGTLVRGRDSFSEKLELLREFVTTYDRLPKAAETYRGIKLGHWICSIRKYKKNGTLVESKCAQLESIDKWTWTPKEDGFDVNLLLLAEFVEQYRRIPTWRESFNGINIGATVNKWRFAYRRRKLSVDNITQLEKIPFWTWNPIDDSFKKKIEILREFITQYDRLPLRDEIFNGVTLSTFIYSMRGCKRNNKLSDDKITQLESLPHWTWTPHQDLLTKNIILLRIFIEQHDRLPSRQDYVDNVCLGTVVTSYRQMYKRSTLSSETIQQLEELPHWTWMHDSFAQKMTLLYDYIKLYNRIPSTTEIFRNIKLGSFVSELRKSYMKGKLNAARITQIEALPHWAWNARK